MSKRGTKLGTKYTVPVTDTFGELIQVLGGAGQVAEDVNSSKTTIRKAIRERRASYTLLVRICVKYNVKVTRLVDSTQFNSEISEKLN